MKRYELVNVKYGGTLSSKIEKHRSIIEEYAAKGYRYVGFIPTDINSHGMIYAIDLIFEIDV